MTPVSSAIRPPGPRRLTPHVGGAFSLLALPQESPQALLGYPRDALRRVLHACAVPPHQSQTFAETLYHHPEAAWQALSAPARHALSAAGYRLWPLTRLDERRGADGTRKQRFRLADGRQCEAAWLPAPVSENIPPTICLSALAGCALRCAFCGTGRLGFERLLKPSEMLAMALSLRATSPDGPVRVAFMGQGEPLMNTAHVITTLFRLHEEWGLGGEAMTISTAGILPQIARLAALPVPPTLALSLHAPDQALRERLIPVARKWPLAVLMPALGAYAHTTQRPVVIQYMLLAGVNDAPEQAEALCALLGDGPYRVDVSRHNPIEACDAFHRPEESRVAAFLTTLRQRGLAARLRPDWGGDIEAGCGQWQNR